MKRSTKIIRTAERFQRENEELREKIARLEADAVAGDDDARRLAKQLDECEAELRGYVHECG